MASSHAKPPVTAPRVGFSRQSRLDKLGVKDGIDRWLEETRAAAIREEIGRYARAQVGTAADLDSSLEAAGIDHLVTRGVGKKGRT